MIFVKKLVDVMSIAWMKLWLSNPSGLSFRKDMFKILKEP